MPSRKKTSNGAAKTKAKRAPQGEQQDMTAKEAKHKVGSESALIRELADLLNETGLK